MIRLRITDQPTPAVTLTGPDGTEVDITRALGRLVVELDPTAGLPWVTLTLRAAVDWSFPVERVGVTGDVLDGLTAAELDAAAASAGMSAGPGAAILAHLRSRLT